MSAAASTTAATAAAEAASLPQNVLPMFIRAINEIASKMGVPVLRLESVPTFGDLVVQIKKTGLAAGKNEDAAWDAYENTGCVSDSSENNAWFAAYETRFFWPCVAAKIKFFAAMAVRGRSVASVKAADRPAAIKLMFKIFASHVFSRACGPECKATHYDTCYDTCDAVPDEEQTFNRLAVHWACKIGAVLAVHPGGVTPTTTGLYESFPDAETIWEAIDKKRKASDACCAARDALNKMGRFGGNRGERITMMETREKASEYHTKVSDESRDIREKSEFTAAHRASALLSMGGAEA